MTKTAMACPFSNKTCMECGLYRGRHHNLSFSKEYRGFTDLEEEHANSGVSPLSVEFQALRKSAEPWAGGDRPTKKEPRIRVKVFDMEGETTRICDLDAVKKWDWSDPAIWRLIDGRHVTNLDGLIEVLCYKAEMGCEEVELYEAPRFMLLAGG